MRKYIKILFLLLIPMLGMAQQSTVDSLHKALKHARTDSARYLGLADLDDYYVESNRDSALYYNGLALAITKKNGRSLDEAWSLDRKGYILMHLGKYPESMECFQQALKLAEYPKNENSWFRYKNYTQHQM